MLPSSHTAHLRRAAALEIAAEVRRDLDGDLELAAAEPVLELVGGSRSAAVRRSSAGSAENASTNVSAFGRSILVERGEAQMLDVE